MAIDDRGNAASELIGGLSDNGKEHGKNSSVLQ
jgi:hypothetical protein